MRQALAAAGIALAISLAIPQSSHATALEEYATALSGGDVPGMREVVSLHQEEMTRDFFLLLREAASILDRSSYVPEERNKARLLEGQRRLATCALLAASDAAAVPSLAGFLGEEPLEPALLHKLGELGGTAAIGILVHQLDHPSAASAAGEALGHIGAPAFPALLQRSQRPGPGRRAAAATLAGAGYQPRSPEEAARLLLVRGERFGLVRLGPLALPVLTAAARGLDAETAATARSVLGLELGLALAALALLALFLRRRWIWPGAELELVPGGRARLSRGLWKRWRRPVETGTVLHTAWARDPLGRRRRIKMEVLASMGPAPEDEPAGTAFDVLVAAGASISPGTYLAVAPAGSVKIRVKSGS